MTNNSCNEFFNIHFHILIVVSTLNKESEEEQRMQKFIDVLRH